MKWARGADTITTLITEGRLERISGTAATGEMHLQSARGLLESAQRETERNPEASYILAYDAVRKAATALLAQQGLRPKSNGHHVTVEEAIRAQFNGEFHGIGMLRRRRSEIEYPRVPGDDVSVTEVADAIQRTAKILDAADQLLPQLSFFRH